MANWILAYVLGHQQMKYKFRLHFFVAMGNHYHSGTSDRGYCPSHSSTPHWMRDFNSLSARALNALRGRRGALWSGGGDTYNFVISDNTEDMIDRYCYGFNNPVAATLVSRRQQWPGLLLEPGPSGKRTIRVKKPPVFFSYLMPDEVEITIETPPSELSPREFMKRVYERANFQERQIRLRAAREGRTFMGAKRIRRQSPFAQPRTYEARGSIRPKIATSDRQKRREFLQEDRRFLHRYEECRDAFRARKTDVEFPVGTFEFIAFFGARCEGRDPPQ